MNYDIRDTDLTRSLPAPLARDETEMAIAKAVAEQLIITANLAEKAVIYSRIDELDEDVLDTLAVDMHVDWYNYEARIDIKRTLIKDSVKVHKHLGTPWAVERVAATYYDDATLQEWFEYGGRPGYFKITINGEEPSPEILAQFKSLLEKVKRKTAWLESITFVIEMTADVYTAASSFHTLKIPLPDTAIVLTSPMSADAYVGGSSIGMITEELSAEFDTSPRTLASAAIVGSNFGELTERLSARFEVVPQLNSGITLTATPPFAAIRERLDATIETE